jgi:glycosyltransferase involved in cell wall biosynthesis
MNILILNWRDVKNPSKGGAEIILYEFCKKLKQKGHTVTWFCSKFSGAKENELFEGINIIRKGNELTVYWHAFRYYVTLQNKPDIVLDCVNTVCWQTPLYIPKEKRILYANQSAQEVFFYEYPFPLSLFCYLLEPLQYITYKNTKTFCYSESIKKDLISFGVKPKNIELFPLGLDHKRYRPGKKSKYPTFVFVARFVKNKRPTLCIEAMKYIVKLYPKAILYLIGYGPEEEKLLYNIKKNHLEKNIIIINKNNTFLQKNKNDIKVTLMQQAWAHILTSVKEGWGMVVTEAAACAAPSIVSNVTGLKDSVIHNKTGIILSARPQARELADAMKKIINDEKLRKTLSKNAIKFSKHFSWEKSSSVFLSLIKKRYSYI